MNVLFVCTGNTCRSPMAEALLRQKAERLGLDLEVKSAGIFALDGDRASKGASEVMRGIASMGGHRARSLDRDLLQWADIIFAMTQSQLFRITTQYPEYKNKAYLLKSFAHGEDEDVEDPYGGSNTIYTRVRNELEEAIKSIIDKIIE